MTTKILHFSDTIQSCPEDTSRHDTTVSRLDLWYKILQKFLGLSQYQTPDFRASTFGDSFQTGAQALYYLEQGNFTSSQVILVNNASRAKHINSGASKGSDCIWMQVEIQGIIHHVVGVDDEVFAVFQHRRVPETPAQKILSVDLTLPNGTRFYIPDVSSGTQFRSKEHFPLIQLILLWYIQKNPQLGVDDVRDIFVCTPHNDFDDTWIRHRVAYILGNDISGLTIAQVISQLIVKIGQIVQDTGEYKKSYLPGFEGIENIQLLGELHILREKFGIFTDEFVGDIGVESDILSLYTQRRKQLRPNQLLLIDRDKFGNSIFAPQYGVGSLQDFARKNNFTIHQRGQHKEVSGLYISGDFGEITAFLTATISDLTGENCIWQSSSAGPDAEKLININTSIGGDGKILSELQGLPIGTIVTLTSIF